ncbi:hypothetical protein F4814DRAFT_408161 [Daldinia grandis]|nr:hypothetical protein F4814DRAFT_408161 [Daldinia grandis]
MSSQDNNPDSDLDIAANYLATRGTTPPPNGTNDTKTGFGSDSNSEDQQRSESPKTVRWAEPIEAEIPSPPSGPKSD